MIIPKVSILLPVRNEVLTIKKTIESLLNQDYPSDKLELIIADGDSDDGTKKILNNFNNKYSKIIIINNSGKTMPKGFNQALILSKSEIIVMVGGHSKLPKNYISKSVKNINTFKVECSGGILDTIGKDYWGKIIASTISSIFGVGNVSFRLRKSKSGFVKSVPFGCYKKSIFEKLDFLDEELIRNQDDEFNFRIIQYGGKIWQDSSLVVKYYSRSNLINLFKQYFEYGLYKVRVIQKRKEVISLRHLIPSIFILSLLIPPLSKIIFLIYYTTNLFFSFNLSKLNVLKLFSFQLTYFIIHLSYGIGFLYGLCKFIFLWKEK